MQVLDRLEQREARQSGEEGRGQRRGVLLSSTWLSVHGGALAASIEAPAAYSARRVRQRLACPSEYTGHSDPLGLDTRLPPAPRSPCTAPAKGAAGAACVPAEKGVECTVGGALREGTRPLALQARDAG